MKNLYLLPLLSLLGLAGCSNSPAPDPYVPPAAPEIIAEPTPVPESGGVINTDAFIAQGDQLVAREKRVTLVPVTNLDRELYQITQRPSMSVTINALLNEIDASNTSLADALLVLKSRIIKAISEGIGQIIDSNPQLAAYDPNLRASQRATKAIQTSLINYAETKYKISTGTIDPAVGRNNMASYRAIARQQSVVYDALLYRSIQSLRRSGISLTLPAQKLAEAANAANAPESGAATP